MPSVVAKLPRRLVDLCRAVHALIGFRQHPELTREVAAFGEVGLVVVRPAIEDVQAHAEAAKVRRQPDRVALLVESPELPREVSAAGKVGLIIVWATIKDV